MSLHAPDAPSKRSMWWLLAIVLLAELMDLLDSTIVNVAGPSLEASLGASPVGLQWVIGGYALTLGAGLVLGGRLGDRFGRRPMFLAGLAAFVTASLLCALAPGVGLLIAFRLLQGVAAASMLPQAWACCATTSRRSSWPRPWPCSAPFWVWVACWVPCSAARWSTGTCSGSVGGWCSWSTSPSV